MAYRIAYSPDAQGHTESFSVRDRAIILDAVDSQLAFQPDVPTRNRKRLRPNELATWAMRLGRFRVYYEVEEGEASPEVRVVAIGVTEHNRLFVGGKEYVL